MSDDALETPSSSSGTDVQPESAAPVQNSPSQATPSSTGVLTWEYGMPLLTNRFFLWDMLRWAGISFGLTYAVVAAAGLIFAQELILLPWWFAAIFGGLILFATLLTVLIFQNRYDTTFTLDDQGAYLQSGSKGRKVNRILTILALLSGKPGAVGSAMLAEARQDLAIEWQDVRKVDVHPGQRVVSLADSWHTAARLYCPPDLFDQVVERVQYYVAHAPRRAPRTFQWRGIRMALAWVSVVAVAAFLCMAWMPEEAYGLVFGAGAVLACSGLVQGVIGRAAALGGILAVLALAARVASLAMEETNFDGLFSVWGYQHDTEFLAITAAGLAALLVAGVWRALRKDGPGA